jgi:hypothetical protein
MSGTNRSVVTPTDTIGEMIAELRSVVGKYKTAIREAYRSVRDPQLLDETLDGAVAAVISELEDCGYAFDTASVDNILYLLDRRIEADESGWSVVRRK